MASARFSCSVVGQQVGPVHFGPGVVLGVGQFQVLGPQRVGHLDDAADVLDVHPVDDHVHHHRPALRLEHLAHPLLQREGLGVREEVVHLAGGVLEGQLNVVQTGGLQGRGPLLGQADAGGEQIGVVAQAVRLGNQHLQVVTHQRLTPRKAALHRAQGARLAQHPQPFFGAQLVFVAGEVGRVVAEHAVQRAAVGHFGQQPQRRPRSGGAAGTHRGQPLGRRWCRHWQCLRRHAAATSSSTQRWPAAISRNFSTSGRRPWAWKADCS